MKEIFFFIQIDFYIKSCWKGDDDFASYKKKKKLTFCPKKKWRGLLSFVVFVSDSNSIIEIFENRKLFLGFGKK